MTIPNWNSHLRKYLLRCFLTLWPDRIYPKSQTAARHEDETDKSNPPPPPQFQVLKENPKVTFAYISISTHVYNYKLTSLISGEELLRFWIQPHSCGQSSSPRNFITIDSAWYNQINLMNDEVDQSLEDKYGAMMRGRGDWTVNVKVLKVLKR